MTVLPLAVNRRSPRPPSTPPEAGGAASAAAPPVGWSPSFEQCFERHYSRVLAYALRRTGDRAGAEDVAAETFLVAWRRIELLPEHQLPWLLGIARHVLLNERRAGRRRERLVARLAAEPTRSGELGDAAAPAAPPSGSPTARGTDGLSEQLHDALARLSPLDREALMLTSWDGLDHRQAAAVLGCSRSTFDVRLHRARRRLARILDLFDDQELS